MEKAYLAFASIFILFGLYYFTRDLYSTLYRIYYESTYLTQISNKYNEFVGKYL